MSFGSRNQKAASDLKPLGADSSHASTAEQARPIPYLAGKQRIALTFISDVFDDFADPVTQSVGKQKSRIGFDYYASFAAAACFGPADGLYNIYLNGDPVYASEVIIRAISLTRLVDTAIFTSRNNHNLETGDVVVIAGSEQGEYNGEQTVTVTGLKTFTFPVEGSPDSPADGDRITARLLLDPVLRDEAHPDYVDVTIPDYGVMRLYWGTETQGRDVYLRTSGIQHPAYRGICYAVFNRLFLGFNQTNVQNVELVLSRYPSLTWLSGQETDEDVSPVSFLADVLQNPRAGLGLSDERIDTTTMIATNDLLVADELGISPVITRQQEARQVISQAMEYFDGYPVFSPGPKMGIAATDRSFVVAELPVVEDADLVERPEFSTDDWSKVATDIYVRFTNRDLRFKEDAAHYRDAGAFNIAGESNSQSVDRAWVTSATTGQVLAAALGRDNALPGISGRLKLRLDSTLFDALSPGSAFTIDHSARDLSNLVFRVRERTLPGPDKPSFEIEFVLDLSYLSDGQTVS